MSNFDHDSPFVSADLTDVDGGPTTAKEGKNKPNHVFIGTDPTNRHEACGMYHVSNVNASELVAVEGAGIREATIYTPENEVDV